MSTAEGKMLACDVCGKSMFLKYLGDGEADGGYTKWRKYEVADGWTRYSLPGVVSTGDLCPECAERIRDTLIEVIGNIKEGT